MILNSDRFADAIEYLAAFCRPTDSITFTPAGEFVRISATGELGYAEYWCKWEKPLTDRFAVQLQVIRGLSREVTDSEIQYTKGSQSLWTAGTRQWWVPFSSVEDIRPQVEAERSTSWDGSFAPMLRLLRSSTREQVVNASSFDCVRIDVRPLKRSMVSTDGTCMTVSIDRTQPDGTNDFGSMLIDRNLIPLIEEVCKSGSRVEIAAGITQFSIKCGRRLAIFPLRVGMYPKWLSILRQQRSPRVLGLATPERYDLYHVARQAAIVCGSLSIHGNKTGLVFDAGESSEFAQVELPATRKGTFGPVKLRASYLKNLASHWPNDTMQLQFRGKDRAVIISSPEEHKRLISLIMPIA
jgi:hypothetical protein